MKGNLPKEQCGMLKILYWLCFLFLFFHCSLNNVFGMLFPVMAAFVVDFPVVIFICVERKSCLKIMEDWLSTHIPLWTSVAQAHKQRKGNILQPGIFCAYFISVLFGDPLMLMIRKLIF